MRSRLVLAAAAALLAGSIPASAALIILSNTNATWWNPTGNTATVTFANNGTGSATVRWGTPVSSNGPKSAYRFAMASNASTTNVPPTTPFTIGTFTHLNNPIAPGTDITGVSLRLTTDLIIDDSDLGMMTFDYAFHHDETPNQRPCTYGSPTDAPCPDAVMVTSMPSSQTLTVNGVALHAELLRFRAERRADDAIHLAGEPDQYGRYPRDGDRGGGAGAGRVGDPGHRLRSGRPSDSATLETARAKRRLSAASAIAPPSAPAYL